MHLRRWKKKAEREPQGAKTAARCATATCRLLNKTARMGTGGPHGSASPTCTCARLGPRPKVQGPRPGLKSRVQGPCTQQCDVPHPQLPSAAHRCLPLVTQPPAHLPPSSAGPCLQDSRPSALGRPRQACAGPKRCQINFYQLCVKSLPKSTLGYRDIT